MKVTNCLIITQPLTSQNTSVLAEKMSAFLSFLYKQFGTQPLSCPEHDFSGQTVIVTGSNIGLGFEAARHFARLNAEKVILAIRNLEKGEKAKASIEESTGRRGVVEVWILDLSSFESVKDFVRRAQALKRLDVMLENAGIATRIYRKAEDNESTITVNVVSTFLLALMILPKLRETAAQYNVRPRLVMVSSGVHGWTNLPEKRSPNIFETLNDKENADMANRFDFSLMPALPSLRS
jgi:retinol dehydrogenase-12